MIPYADLLYFGVSLYVIIPSIALGLTGRLTWRWTAVATVAMTLAQFAVFPPADSRPSWLNVLPVVGFTLWQWVAAAAFRRLRSRLGGWGVWAAVVAAVAPLAWLKTGIAPSPMGFLGVSYVTIRALDVVLGIHDGLVAEITLPRYATYLLFFPTLSAGPIDRWRRFDTEARLPLTSS